MVLFVRSWVNIGWLLGVLAGCNESLNGAARKASHVAKIAALNPLCSACMLLCYLVAEVKRV